MAQKKRNQRHKISQLELYQREGEIARRNKIANI